jgi:hypothetical protein
MKGTKVYYKLSKESEDRTAPFVFTPNITHVQVAMCPSDWDNHQIFEYFNIGEGLTSSGAQAKIRSTPDLHHTSMSVGDVLMREDDKCYLCENLGWRELTKQNYNFQEVWK